MTTLLGLPRELLDLIHTFCSRQDLSTLRLVNKCMFETLEDTVYGYEASVTFGSRWFQYYYWCNWCCNGLVPVNNLLCKEFQCCEACEPEVVKTCSSCGEGPICFLYTKTCDRCTQSCCWSCVEHLSDLKFDDPNFYCSTCLLALGYYFLCA